MGLKRLWWFIRCPHHHHHCIGRLCCCNDRHWHPWKTWRETHGYSW